MTSILITGGTGFLGQHLARALLTANYHVHLGGRNFNNVQTLLQAGAIAVPFDLRDRTATMTACAGIEVVCHLGALSAPWGNKREFWDTNVGGTQAVIEGCRRNKVRRLIHISSPSVIFAGRNQFNLTETAPYPKSFMSDYARTKKIAEEAVSASGLNAISLRPKAIFGPGDQALLPRLIAAARAGRLPMIGDGENLVDLTYVENVVHAIRLAIEHNSVNGIFMITNDEHPALWNVIQTVCRRLKIPNRLHRVPPSLALALATLMEWRATFTGVEPLLTRYTVALLHCTQTYDISAAKQKLDYRPLVSVAEGIERTLADYDSN